MNSLPAKITMVPCRQCAAKNLNCYKWDIPELQLNDLTKETAERLVMRWNAPAMDSIEQVAREFGISSGDELKRHLLLLIGKASYGEAW